MTELDPPVNHRSIVPREMSGEVLFHAALFTSENPTADQLPSIVLFQKVELIFKKCLTTKKQTTTYEVRFFINFKENNLFFQ